MAPPVPHSQLNLRFANVQPDPKENPDGNPNRLTERSLVSKRLGDSEEGDFTSKRPVLTHDVLDRLQELEPIESECRRRSKERGIFESNKFFKFNRTGVIYEGEWLSHKPHGFGKNFYPSGGYYEGSFTAGLPNGFGRFVNANGDYYQGEVKFGRGNGEGMYVAGDVVYTGRFKDNVLHGEGEEKGNNYFFSG